MSLARSIDQHRSILTLVLIVILCFVSLASGLQASRLGNALRSAVGLVAHPFLALMGGVSESLDYASGLVIDYGAMRRENEILHNQLASMMNSAAGRSELLAENVRLRDALGFVREERRSTLVPVDVVARDQGSRSLRIDQGERNGVTPSMCAVTEQGVVGVVTRVDAFESVVLTTRHSDCRIGAMIKRNRVRGTVYGGRGEIMMHYIDPKDEVREGDLVVTSPESVFPAGYSVGRVVAVHSSGVLWKSAEIQPSVDPQRVDEMFVVIRSSMLPDEIGGGSNVSDISVAPVMPDMRSLQERFAP